VSPGAGSPQKRWPEASYRELIRRLLQKQACRVLVIAGAAEPGLGPSLISGLPPDRAILADGLRLDVVSALLSRCCAHVGNDSGISHLAAGLGIPSVVLFGPTEPELWAPLGPRVEILRDTSACRACRRRSNSSHQCLAAITPDLVMERIVTALYGPANAPAMAGDKAQKAQSISIPPLASMHSPTR
jgi:ADP-heptose:LPS heptosyltransferase